MKDSKQLANLSLKELKVLIAKLEYLRRVSVRHNDLMKEEEYSNYLKYVRKLYRIRVQGAS